MQLNNLFQSAQAQPTVLPKATFEELKNNHSRRPNTYMVDIYNPQESNVRQRLSPEMAEMVLETCKRLKSACNGAQQLYLTTVDSTKTFHYASSATINNPCFFLSTHYNSYYIENADFSKINVKSAEIIAGTANGHGRSTPKQWALSVEIGGEEFSMLCSLKTVTKFGNFKVLANGDVSIGGFKFQMTPLQVFIYISEMAQYLHRENGYLLNYSTVSQLYGSDVLNKDELNQLMIQMMSTSAINWIELTSTGSGVSKIVTKYVAPYLSDLRKAYPLHYCILKSIIQDTSRTNDSVKLSTIFNASFDGVSSLDDLVSRIWPAGWDMEKNFYSYYSSNASTLHWYTNQPSYKEGRRKALKSQGNRAITKIMEEVESLNLDEKTYPKTYAAITGGEIAISTFFRKSEQYFIFNDNWKLWEEMLTKFPDITKELAASAAPRTTYEKDLMSYFYFVLHTLPDYLKAQTGEKWTCSPRLVNSERELDPPKEDEGGTPGVTRQRSALTPIVDNDKKTVVVPYASLAIYGGRGTTYCYSLDYQVLKKGFSFKGNVVMGDVESKLNGRDDYGLMFYTLTGSEQGRGYPTFLIIFERRKTGTHVHFHRTHPSRSKDGDYNPIHNWTRVCYNWMIGNVAKENIIAQQGDLAFVKTEDDGKKDFTEFVKAYDNHIFENIVAFSPYVSKTKTNILGYVKLEVDNVLQHHEHEWVNIPAGIYTVYQCRSWECNPTGTWSLRID